MAGQTDTLKRVISELNTVGIEYMIVGSFAASAHGMVRDTHDLDLVVVMSKDSVEALADRLGEGFYFDVEGAKEAVDRADVFNIIDYEGSVKVDFWMLKDEEFRATQFSRKRLNTVWGIPVYVESAEDTILSKLLWNQISPSERQLDDVRGVLLVKKGALDYDYLRGWAVRLGVWEKLSELMEEESQCQENHS